MAYGKKIRILLHRLIGVEIHEREVMGEMQKCISIPLKPNGIREYKGKYYTLNLLEAPLRPNPKNRLDSLSLSYENEMVEEYYKIKELGYWNQVSRMGYTNSFKLPAGWGNYKNRERNVDLDSALDNED